MHVELGGVDPGSSGAYDALLGVEHGGGGDGNHCAAAVGALQPRAPAAYQRGDTERVEAVGGRARGEQQLSGLADQGGSRPAQGRIGGKEHDAAERIGFVGDVGAERRQVTPAVSAIEQRLRQDLRHPGWCAGRMDDRVVHNVNALCRTPI